MLFIEPDRGAVLRRAPAAVVDARHRRRAVGDRARLRDPCRACWAGAACSAPAFDLPGWRMAILQVLLATVDVAVTAGDRLHAAAAGAGADLPALPRRLCRLLHGGAGGQHPGRHRRVRHRDADRPRPVPGSLQHRRRHRDVPPALLHHPAVPGRRPVRRQRDPAARAFAAAPGADAARRGAGGALERARFRGGRHHRRGDALRRPAAVPGRGGSGGRISPGSTPTSPRSPRRPENSCPA